ncbi:MAG: hypothetical protein HYT98_03900 [Candidatus Sungbacteria bacterium]|nr:hypothetical protein [Candidatus Sungbacteria bacterium]
MPRILIYGVGAYAAGIGRTLDHGAENRITYWMPVNTSGDVELFVKLLQDPVVAGQNMPHKILMPPSEYTADIGTIREVDIAMVAVAAKYAGTKSWLCKRICDWIVYSDCKPILVMLSKGFDADSNMPLGMAWAKNLEEHTSGKAKFAVLSGPTFAHDLAEGKPCVASIASRDPAVIRAIKRIFRKTNLRLIETGDVTGVSLGGCLKNVGAIGDGYMDVVAPPEESSKYRRMWLCEMKTILDFFGAAERTLYSPAVKGDFLYTVSGPSRNREFGRFIAGAKTYFKEDDGKFRSSTEIKEVAHANTVEGFDSLKGLYKIAQENSLSTPLLYGIHALACLGTCPLRLFYTIWYQNAKTRYLNIKNKEV